MSKRLSKPKITKSFWLNVDRTPKAFFSRHHAYYIHPVESVYRLRYHQARRTLVCHHGSTQKIVTVSIFLCQMYNPYGVSVTNYTKNNLFSFAWYQTWYLIFSSHTKSALVLYLFTQSFSDKCKRPSNFLEIHYNDCLLAIIR